MQLVLVQLIRSSDARGIFWYTVMPVATRINAKSQNDVAQSSHLYRRG